LKLKNDSFDDTLQLTLPLVAANLWKSWQDGYQLTINFEVKSLAPEEIADGPSCSGMLPDDISLNTCFFHAFFYKRFKNVHPTGYTTSDSIVEISRKSVNI